MKNKVHAVFTKVKPLFSEVFRYATTGIFVFSAVYAANNILFNAGMLPWAATLSSSAVATVLGYILHAKFSFRVTKHNWDMPVKFALRQVACIIVAQVAIFVCYNIFDLNYPIASFMAAASSTVVAFLLAKFWVFPKTIIEQGE